MNAVDPERWSRRLAGPTHEQRIENAVALGGGGWDQPLGDQAAAAIGPIMNGSMVCHPGSMRLPRPVGRRRPTPIAINLQPSEMTMKTSGSKLTRGLAMRMGMLTIAAAAAWMAGCGVAGEPLTRARGEESAAAFRIESEWVPSARLVKEDMTPRWQLGRYAFVPGGDNLLVLSRIMSVPARNKDEKIDPSQPRRETKLERVWLVLPRDLPTGVPVKIERMERVFLTGYDLGELDDTQFIHPNRMLGQLTVVEYGQEKVTVIVNINVRPVSDVMTEWSWNEMVEVPVVADGRRATKPEPGRTYKPASVREDLLASLGVESAVAGSSPPGTGEGGGTTPGAGTIAVATGPGGAGEGGGTVAPSPFATERSIVGRWSAQTEKVLYQLTFDPSGSFSYATVRQDRRGASPSLMGGEWQIKGEYVVLAFQQQANDSRSDQPSMFRRRYEALRIGWNGSRLILTGQITAEDGPVRLELQPSVPVDRSGQPVQDPETPSVKPGT